MHLSPRNNDGVTERAPLSRLTNRQKVVCTPTHHNPLARAADFHKPEAPFRSRLNDGINDIPGDVRWQPGSSQMTESAHYLLPGELSGTKSQ